MKKTTLNKTVLLSALLVELGTSAQAATINVDGFTCNFNDAIIAANTDTATGGCDAGSGDDILELMPDAELPLNGQAIINSNVTINGHGSTLKRDVNGSAFLLMSIENATVTINETHLSHGLTPDGTGVGGIYVSSSALVFNHSTVSNTTGGGLVFFDSTGEVNNSTITNTGNVAGSFYGGALTVANNSDVLITNSTFHGNNNLDENTGGTISVNGYYGGSSLTVRNTTISGNSGSYSGGGISVRSYTEDYGSPSNITLENVTIVGNSSGSFGGGIYNDVSTFTISQSIISGNTAVNGNEVYSATDNFVLNNFNLFGLDQNSGATGITLGGSDIIPIEASISDIIETNLRDNGGATLTHALNPNGPAVDVIPAASCELNEDQTGSSRPLDADGDGNADCDIGAVENLDIIFRNDFG